VISLKLTQVVGEGLFHRFGLAEGGGWMGGWVDGWMGDWLASAMLK